MYEILVGVPPFYSEDMGILYRQIKQNKYEFPIYLSPDAEDLVQRLLCKDPSKRLDIEGVKKHVFFKEFHVSLNFEKIKKF